MQFLRVVRSIVAIALFVAAPIVRAGEWDGVAFQQPGAAGVAAWFGLPTKLVLDDADLPANLANRPAPYLIRACRGENECVQLVLMLAEPVDKASVEVSDFAMAGGGSGANVPASTWKANIVGQVPGRLPPRAASNLITWEPPAPTAATRIPDPLLSEKTFPLDRGMNRIWLTVKVPADAAPGDYAGKVTVRRGDGVLLDVPLGLRVWKQTMPEESSLLVLGNVWSNAEQFARLGDGKPLWEHLKPYYDNLKAHRINAAGEIYPAPIWARNAPPPKTDEYDAALKHVLDDLGFLRFRFPGVAGTGSGTWQGTEVFAPPGERFAGGTWLSGSAFTKSFPEDWARVGKTREGGEEEFGAARLAAHVEGPPPWVEYEFKLEQAQALWVWLQAGASHAAEAKTVALDGEDLGTIEGKEFLAGRLGFANVSKPINVAAGQHTLRVTLNGVSPNTGAADPIYGVFLTPDDNPDLDQVLRDRFTLSEDFKQAFQYHARAAGDFLRSRKWLKKAQAKLKDEPSPAEYVRVEAVYDYAGEILPSVRRELSEHPTSTLRKSVEVWAPSLGGSEPIDPEGWSASLEPGDELWAYHNALHTLGYPAVAPRLIPWILGRHGIKGYAFYAVNAWNEDPWKETGQENAFLRGTLIYPDPKTGAPIDSIRWELFREGLEDYELLRLLRVAADVTYASGSADAKRQAALAETERFFSDDVPAFVRSARDFSWNPAGLEILRTRAGELLNTLSD